MSYDQLNKQLYFFAQWYLFKSIDLFLLPIAITPWDIFINNKEIIKGGFTKMQTSWVFAQWVTNSATVKGQDWMKVTIKSFYIILFIRIIVRNISPTEQDVSYLHQVYFTEIISFMADWLQNYIEGNCIIRGAWVSPAEMGSQCALNKHCIMCGMTVCVWFDGCSPRMLHYKNFHYRHKEEEIMINSAERYCDISW